MRTVNYDGRFHDVPERFRKCDASDVDMMLAACDWLEEHPPVTHWTEAIDAPLAQAYEEIFRHDTSMRRVREAGETLAAALLVIKPAMDELVSLEDEMQGAVLALHGIGIEEVDPGDQCFDALRDRTLWGRAIDAAFAVFYEAQRIE